MKHPFTRLHRGSFWCALSHKILVIDIILFYHQTEDTPLPGFLLCCPYNSFLYKKGRPSSFLNWKFCSLLTLEGFRSLLRNTNTFHTKSWLELTWNTFVTHRYRCRGRWGHMVITDARGQQTIVQDQLRQPEGVASTPVRGVRVW